MRRFTCTQGSNSWGKFNGLSNLHALWILKAHFLCMETLHSCMIKSASVLKTKLVDQWPQELVYFLELIFWWIRLLINNTTDLPKLCPFQYAYIFLNSFWFLRTLKLGKKHLMDKISMCIAPQSSIWEEFQYLQLVVWKICFSENTVD